MEQPFWKKWLSFVQESVVLEVPSEHSGTIEVIYYQDRYGLRTNQAVYSLEDLYFCFRDSFEQLPINQLKINRVLVLGMGLGSIPIMLERNFGLVCHYDLVEIDQAIIPLAEEYGYGRYNLQSTTTIHCADAFDFVQNCTEKFDLIAIDLFIDDLVPSKFETVHFLRTCKQILSPSGLIMYNRLADTETFTLQTHVFFEKKFKKVFSDAFFYEIKGNKMLISRHI